MTFKQCIKYDDRPFYKIFLNTLSFKIKIIQVFLNKNYYENIHLLLNIYFFKLLINFSLGALLFSDHLISEKYHNKGKLNFVSQIFVIFFSRIISILFSFIINNFTLYYINLEILINESKFKKNKYEKYVEKYLKN